jgi:hypothetical protein
MNQDELFKDTNWVSAAGCINVLRDVEESDIPGILSDGRLHTIQFYNKPSDKTWHLLNDNLFSKRPDVFLRITDYPDLLTDFNFLLEMSNVRNLSLMLSGLTSLEVFGKIEQLEGLIIEIFEKTGLKQVSLEPISKLSRLTHLRLEGYKKDIESLSKLINLQRLKLYSITLDNLDFLTGLDKLERLSFVLCGTHNYSALKHLKSLTFFELWEVRGLADIEFISELKKLRYLIIKDLRNVEKLPSFSQNYDQIEKIIFANLKGLTDVSSLSLLNNLQEFLFASANNFSPADFTMLSNLKNLRMATIGFGSKKKNEVFQELMDSSGIKKYDADSSSYKG